MMTGKKRQAQQNLRESEALLDRHLANCAVCTDAKRCPEGNTLFRRWSAAANKWDVLNMTKADREFLEREFEAQRRAAEAQGRAAEAQGRAAEAQGRAAEAQRRPAEPAPVLKFDLCTRRQYAIDMLNAGYRVLSVKHHPDKGGSNDVQRILNDARGWAREIIERSI